jgi:membrane-bound lytic murein transglycosylase A
MIRVVKGFISILFVFLLFSCLYQTVGPPKTTPELCTTELISENNWPCLVDDADRESLRQALTQSLIYIQKGSPQKTYPLGTREISGEEIRSTLVLLLELLDSNSNRDVVSLERELKAHFNLYQLVFPKRSASLLTTGYYEPTLTGSRAPSDRFPFPLYRKPDDLLTIELENFSSKYKGERLVGRLLGRKVLPYYSRREIDQEGKLAGRGLELYWTDDRLKLFFMQIQGSGRVVLEDGVSVQLQYQAINGHPYFPIGRELIRRDILRPEEVSLQRIYSYLKDHPEEQEGILNLNPSYVFFQEAQGGPYGSLNVPLTPGRSVAMDLRIFPSGGLAWLTAVKPVFSPDNQILYWVPMNRWVLVQDSGGAIKGPERLDFFWGNGEQAEMAAGHQRHGGTISFILKK